MNPELSEWPDIIGGGQWTSTTMNAEGLLTKLQAERKIWQDRADEQLTKGEQAALDNLVNVLRGYLDQAAYDKGVAWVLCLASTLILQEQLKGSLTHGTAPPAVAPSSPPHPESAVP